MAKGYRVAADDDRAMFARMFEPHLGQAYRLARWLVGNSTDAQDVVQEAAIRAFRGIRGCSGANPRAWSLTIVRNTALSWISRSRAGATTPIDEEQEIVDPQTPELSLLRQAEGAEVRRAIAALPSAFREAIVLREINELSYREIADMTGVPIGTVMSRLSRARSLLIQELGKVHEQA